MNKHSELTRQATNDELCISFDELEAGDDGPSFSDRFEMIKPLGKGSFGMVILAQDKSALWRERAVKVATTFQAN